MKVGFGGVPRNGIPETRHASTAISKKPPPEVGAFGGSAQDAPGTAEEREVQQNDGIRRTQPQLDGIIRAEIPIQDPLFFLDEPFLQLDPLNTGSRREARTPEDLVEFHHRQAADLTELPRKSRFPSRTATEYDDALHKRSFRPPTPRSSRIATRPQPRTRRLLPAGHRRPARHRNVTCQAWCLSRHPHHT